MASVSYPILPRLMYAALWLLALPAVILLLLFRSLAQPGYRRHLSERFAVYPSASAAAPLWCHAASLGEVHALKPLLLALRADFPDLPLLITCQTPAGRQAAQALKLAACSTVYLPIDLRWLTRRFLAHFRPRAALIVETEIWPNLFQAAQRAGIPVMMVNARMTERSLRRYRRFGGVFRGALSIPEAILCQSAADAARFVAAGAAADAVSVTGNLKWDLAGDAETQTSGLRRRAAWTQTPVWMAASTHPEEEAAVLAAHAAVLEQWPSALLIWAPRHPERFAAAAALAESRGLRVRRRSRQPEPSAQAQVFVIDTLGELRSFMPGMDLVFVGGSLQAIGGHNVLEPAAAGVPVLVGPHTAHFADSVAALADAGGLLQVADADDLRQCVTALLDDAARRTAMASANISCVMANRGALEKTKARVSPCLGSAG
ncbi:lipid IV(A) 3-deoxy-D-manno-octulosonic acid transferase [Arenimonas sp. GDDSR-1]|uniref:lipid IV(A) 3-deoxy-D-manno-octulosonic acid transferase n=1 Tax=Arenimonas sp. GDDSR-1 TaxID=2950125 RepID=UPI002610FE0B|nr:lipid IV(A) 3-deoxy-D-manno-octulosonic acid transferase [Arenimonas sp. GDDSR-1]